MKALRISSPWLKAWYQEKGSETLSPELMKMVKGTYVRILDEEMKKLIDNGIEMQE